MPSSSCCWKILPSYQTIQNDLLNMYIELANMRHGTPSHINPTTTTISAQQETPPPLRPQSTTITSFRELFWGSDHDEPHDKIKDPTVASSERHRKPLRRMKTTPALSTQQKALPPLPPQSAFSQSDLDESHRSTKGPMVTSSKRHRAPLRRAKTAPTISVQQKTLPPSPPQSDTIKSFRSLFGQRDHDVPHEPIKDPIVTATDLLQERLNALQQRIEYLEDRRAVSCRIHNAMNDSSEDLKLRMTTLEDRVEEQSTVTRAELSRLESGVTRAESRMGGLVRSLWKIVLKSTSDDREGNVADDEDEVADSSSCSSVADDDTFSVTDKSPCSTSATTPEDENIPSSECLPLKNQAAPCYFSSAPIKEVHFEDEEPTKRPRRRDDKAWLRTRTIWMDSPTGQPGKVKQMSRPCSQ